jgi:hypothetical protein
MNCNIALVAASLIAFVAAPASAVTPQQEKMKTCNAEAKTKALSGDDRKAFMKQCLSANKDAAKSAQATQQEKMKACNAEAKTKALSGDERKTFMSSCLSS